MLAKISSAELTPPNPPKARNLEAGKVGPAKLQRIKRAPRQAIKDLKEGAWAKEMLAEKSFAKLIPPNPPNATKARNLQAKKVGPAKLQ